LIETVNMMRKAAEMRDDEFDHMMAELERQMLARRQVQMTSVTASA